MKNVLQRAILKQAIAGFLCIVLLMAMAPIIPVQAASPIAIPVCVELEKFTSSIVSGDSGSTLLWARGHAETTTDERLRIAKAAKNQNGTVVRRNKIKLTGGFSTYFVMNLNGGTNPPADGLVFIVQNNQEPRLGDYGGGLGYRGIPNSFGVEFDIWNNAGEDNGYGVYDSLILGGSSNHVAIVQNGSNDHRTSNANKWSVPPGFLLHGSDVHVWIDYAEDGTLYVAYGKTNRYDEATKFSKNVGTELKDQDVYVGFSASTGNSTANHDVKKWYFSDRYVSGGLSPVAGTYTQGANSVEIALQPDSANPAFAYIKVKDTADNDMESQTVSVYINDDTTPTETLDTGADGTQAIYAFSDLPVGTHSIRAVASSGGGATNTVQFEVTDTTPPSAPSVTITDPQGYDGGWTNSDVSFEVGGSIDPESGISRYEYSLDEGVTWSTENSGTIRDNGEYILLSRAVNGAGLISGNSPPINIRIDKIKPTGTFSITATNGDTLYTRSPVVNLAISGNDTGGSGISRMEISNHADFSTSSGRIPYDTEYPGWHLPDENGTKAVFMRFIDSAGNISTTSSASITYDTIPAVLSSVTLVSDNANPGKAKKGDALILDFVANEPVEFVTVEIAGQAVAPINASGDQMTFQAVYSIPEDTTLDGLDGENVPFSITTTDLAGNVSNPVESVTFGIGVLLDFTKPEIILSGTQDASGAYITPVTLFFNEGTASLMKDSIIMDSHFENGGTVTEMGSYSITVTDDAGNRAEKSFIYTLDYTHLISDKENLAIGYADGDNENHVTRNLTLPLAGANGTTIAWHSSDIFVAPSGEVTRPIGSDATVVLTATLSKGSTTDTKTFTVRIKRQPDTGSDAGKAQEDIENVRIVYAEGDHSQSVTQTVYLSSNGIYWNAPITWSSPDTSIVISDTSVNGSYKAEVNRPVFENGDKTVVLTASAEYGSATEDRYFTLLVKRLAGTDAQKVREDADSVSVSYDTGDDENHVTQDIVLHFTPQNGSCVEWKSSNTSIITYSGQVTRPNMGQGDQTVTITATVTHGEEQEIKIFPLVVLENTRDIQIGEDLIADRDNLQIIYRNEDTADSVTTHLILPSTGVLGSRVTWETDNSAHIDANGIVTRALYGEGDTPVTLTASLTKNLQTVTRTFNLLVKEQPLALSDQVQEDYESVDILYAPGDSRQSVTQNLGLYIKGANGSTITWISDTPSIVTDTGIVNRQDDDGEVLLAATITKEGITRTKDFSVRVLGRNDVSLYTDYEHLNIGYADGDSAESVTRTMYLPTAGVTGTTITWSSSRTDLVTLSGRVTRPAPDESDRWVILTATITNPHTGQSTVKTFEVNVKKMNDDDAVQEAARRLNLDAAFSFSPGDTWESVTRPFLILTEGDFDTSINWDSSNPEIISFGNGTDTPNKTDASVFRQDRDSQVILTATITRNDRTITKTFLMIVKSSGLDNAAEETRQTTSRTAEASITGGSQPLDILRTTMNNGEKIDTVIMDESKIQSLTDSINPFDPNTGNRTVTVTVKQCETDPADEQAVEIPAMAISALSDRNGQFIIASDTADIRIDSNEMGKIAQNGTDLYFRLVPLRKSSYVDQMRAIIQNDENLKQAVEGKTLTIQGIPRMIETNYTGFDTYLTIPLDEIDIPAHNTQQFLSSLRVFVQHCDGTTEVLTGDVVYRNNRPYGIEIKINHFSSFQIIRIDTSEQKSRGSSSGSERTPYAETVSAKTEVLEPDGITIRIDTAEEGEYTGQYGRTVITGTDDEKKVSIQVSKEKVLDKLLEDPDINRLSFSVSDEQCHEVELLLPGEIISVLERENGRIALEKGGISFNVEPRALEMEKAFPASDSGDITIQISLARMGTEKLDELAKLAEKKGVFLVDEPFQLSATISDGEKTMPLSPFGTYAELTAVMPEGFDRGMITTAVRTLEDGSLLHIPTAVIKTDGQYDVRINNLEDGIFAFIRHSLVFDDMIRHWAEEDVNDMGSRRVVNGVGTNRYEPELDITRAEFAAIMIRALGLKPGVGSNPFNDVCDMAWYRNYIVTAAKYQLVNGYRNGLFGPLDKITHEQAMTMIARAMKITGLLPELSEEDVEEQLINYTDWNETAAYAEFAFAACIDTGVVTGRNSYLLTPKINITRAEVAVLVRRLLQKSNLI